MATTSTPIVPARGLIGPRRRAHMLLRSRWLPAGATLALWAVLAAALAIASDGVVQDDELTHYLIARWSWTDPRFLLDVWGRPGFTIPNALVAQIGNVAIGFTASRLFTAAIVVASAWLTYRVGRHLRLRTAGLIPLVLLLMPLNFSYSYTPSTETMAQFYAIAGTWLATIGRRRSAAAVWALLPLTRHELALFLLPIGLYLLWRGDWIAVLLLAWAEAAWNLASFSAGMPWPLLRFFTAENPHALGHASVLHYYNRWIEMSGIGIAALSAAGAMLLLYRESRALVRTPRATLCSRTRLLQGSIAASALGLIALQALLYAHNRFASGGYARFLLPAAPFLAICAAYALLGLVRLSRGSARSARPLFLLVAVLVIASACINRQWRQPPDAVLIIVTFAMLVTIAWPARPAMLVACLAVVALGVIQWIPDVRPHRIGAHQILIGRTVDALEQAYPDCRIVGQSPWVWYFARHAVLPRQGMHSGLDQWDTAAAGNLIYLYDESHAADVDDPLRRIRSRPYELLGQRWLLPADRQPYLQIFRRLPDR